MPDQLDQKKGMRERVKRVKAAWREP
jgi:hypothetical protein